MLYVGLAYEYGFENRNQEALNALEIAGNKLKEFTENHSSKNMCEALQHIIFSTTAHLLREEGNLDIAAEVSLILRYQKFRLILINSSALFPLRLRIIFIDS